MNVLVFGTEVSQARKSNSSEAAVREREVDQADEFVSIGPQRRSTIKMLQRVDWVRRCINGAGAATTLGRAFRISKALFGDEFPVALEVHVIYWKTQSHILQNKVSLRIWISAR